MQDWLRPLLLGMLLTAVLRGLLQRLQFAASAPPQAQARGRHVQSVFVASAAPAGSFYAQRYAGEISQRLALNDKVADVLSGRLATTVIERCMMLVYVGVMLQYDVLLTGLAWAVRREPRRLAVDGATAGGCQHAAYAGVGQTGRAVDGRSAEHGNPESLGPGVGFLCALGRVLCQGDQCPAGAACTNQTLGVLPTLLSALATMLVLVVGGLRVMDGHLSLGMLVAFQSLMQSFLAPVTTPGRLWQHPAGTAR